MVPYGSPKLILDVLVNKAFLEFDNYSFSFP